MGTLDRFRVTGKVAAVTGATKGLGKEIARTLAEAGASVVINSRNQGEAEATAAEIMRDFGVKSVAAAGDAGKPGVAESVVEAALKKLGGLHIIVNNAGINVRGAIDAVTPENFDQVMSTNIKAPWLLCRAAAPTLKSQRYGRVINICSTLSLVGMADRSLYCSSKGALAQFTREFAIEMAPFEVTVNGICPGPFETEMNKVLMDDKERYAKFANFTALGRWGRMGEIGPVALFLASEASSYVTGTLLPVDGGWVAW